MSTSKKVWRKIRKTIVIDSRDRQITTSSSPGQYNIVLPCHLLPIFTRLLFGPTNFRSYNAVFGVPEQYVI